MKMKTGRMQQLIAETAIPSGIISRKARVPYCPFIYSAHLFLTLCHMPGVGAISFFRVCPSFSLLWSGPFCGWPVPAPLSLDLAG